MIELFIGLITVVFLYWLGGILLDETPHRPIQQMNDEERKIWKAQIKKVKENLKEEEE